METQEDKPKRRKAYRKAWSIRHDGISDMERMEYLRTGMIRIKEPIVFAEERKMWPCGCYRNINIKEVLGGEELLSWNPELELTLIARVYMTEYGVIGTEDKGSHYLLEVVEKWRRKSVLNNLDWYGLRARIVGGGFIAVYKEELIYD